MLYLLLAAYNEEHDLRSLLTQIKEQHWDFPYRVVLVNDGSTDRTAMVADSFSSTLPLTLINHGHNRGLGAALATGFKSIFTSINDDDLLVTMDADATHPPRLIPKLMKRIGAECDVVIASRFCKGGTQSGLPLIRRIMSWAAGALFSVLWPIRGVSDYTSGFRAYSGKLVKMLFSSYGDPVIVEHGFAATLELLLKSGCLSKRIDEIPLELDYSLKTGESKMRVVKTIVTELALILRMRKALTKQRQL